MFATLSRSWEFAKVSYRMLWDHKQLLVFPIISTVAATIVIASFLLPLWGTGTLQHWQEFTDTSGDTGGHYWLWFVLFLFYFCNYLVIVFFNSGLTACVLQVLRGEAPTLGHGFSMASKRLPQIVAWAAFAAVVGVLIKVIENSHEKAGAIIAAVLGSAWTALTYFVVPVIVIEGLGPIGAFKRSVGTLKESWGTALVGNFSMGLLSILVMLPLILIAGGLVFLGFTSGSLPLLVLGIAVGAMLVVIGAAASSAADMVFTVLLYHWATGEMMPAEVDTQGFEEAFRPRG
ncbi:MAG: DUF6159 family protein [Phycisphaeraceae bacterium]